MCTLHYIIFRFGTKLFYTKLVASPHWCLCNQNFFTLDDVLVRIKWKLLGSEASFLSLFNLLHYWVSFWCYYKKLSMLVMYNKVPLRLKMYTNIIWHLRYKPKHHIPSITCKASCFYKDFLSFPSHWITWHTLCI